MADVESNRAAQREIYGAPLGDVLGRCREVLGLNQSQLAAVLGISAPMLSQVMSGQRIKIGNPSAVRRLQVMVEVLDDVASGAVGVSDALARIDDAGASGEALTGTARRVSARDTAGAVQAVFRGVAAATDHLGAADLLEESHPAIAELLRTYGAGSLDDAVAHLSRTDG
ncbi:helix-turn-helix domain-containing protein [Aeromicrobium sp. Leaf350]|uniref:helix-turn-helix domain-containing protein n=1 Tax=Aeromicrobium sp. Leaf350 TaxID=2876565 RepID=UPI001E3BEA5F|nr:helix-turn-helix transcriptional regulator [Aeromicrobium sp. Leaf350]